MISFIKKFKRSKSVDKITTKFNEPETDNVIGSNYIKMCTVCYGLFMCVLGICICTIEPFKTCKHILNYK
jgi:hypothetical protein